MRTGSDGKKILSFASELKALLATGFAERTVNPIAVHHYLSFYAIPTPYTILQSVEALPAGHSLTFQDNRLAIREYWNIPTIEPLTQSEDSIREELRELLEESIRLRMIADVPVGAFLSGGLDSSAVVALMTRISGEQLKTFSIGFDQQGASMDERSAARVIAELYGTDHTEVIVTGRDVCEQIDEIVLGMDQPSGDGLNTYFVSQATAKHVKVALSGLGGDELFAGYPQFKMFQQADRASGVWQKLPSVAQTAARGTAAIADPIQRAMTWLDGDVLDRYERVRVLYDEAEKLALYAPDVAAALGIAERSIDSLRAYVNSDETDPIAQVTRLELKGYMAHTLLRDTDAMSMAHSLEVRVPLIDHMLVEFAARIPTTMKLRDGRTKWILAEALRDMIPQEVIDRPKRGFEMPVASWMRNEVRPILEDALSRESVERRGLFRYENVQAIYQNFLNGKGPYMRVWSLVMLELWMRRAIDQPIVY
jgi:asparagine synthase (glutamine-hydrolysing)